MLKLRIALGVAFIVAVLTAAVGIMQGARALTVLTRTLVSLFGFGLGAFLLAYLVEHHYKSQLTEINIKGQTIDITNKDSGITDDELLKPSYVEPQFSPLIPENLERLSTKE